MSASEDAAERYFGTPERVLRRRHLCPGEEERDVKDGGKNQLPPEDTDAGPSRCEDFLGPPDAPEVPSSADRHGRPSTTSTVDAVIAFLFHLIAIAFFLYFYLDYGRFLVTLKEERGMIVPESDKYGGHYKFLTHLNYHVLAGYFVLALACDILPWLRRHLHKFVDFIFTTTAFPAAMSVTVLFWGFTMFARPYSIGEATSSAQKFFDALPPYLNHTFHTVVGLAVILEVILVHHRYPSSSDAVKSLLIWNVSYAAWVYWCYFQDGTLPYPLFRFLGPYYMSLFFVFLFITSTTLYYLGRALTGWCWEVRN